MIVDRRIRGAYCLHHQGSNHFTRQYIPEDNSEHHTRRRENLKSHTEWRLLCSPFLRVFDIQVRGELQERNPRV
jgi:hypothetical protein